MKSLRTLAALALFSLPTFAQDAEWRDLFPEKGTDGWHNPFTWGEVWREGEEVHLKANNKFFLVTEEEFGDFELTIDVMVPEGPANSGIQFRSHYSENRVWGYQAEVDPTERGWAGGIYDEGRRAWLVHPEKGSPESKAFDRSKWNSYRILCVGDHSQVWVNGVKTADLRDTMDLSGHIAIQHHGEKGQTYKFRRARIRDLGRHEWTPLFNGDDLSGWRALPGGEWKVQDGVIVGTSPATERRHGILLSERSYEDFTARIKVKMKHGDSGFYFRAEPNDSGVGVHGFQAELDTEGEAKEFKTAGLYETGGRAWVVNPDQKKVAELWKEDGWNEVVVSAWGRDVSVRLNGHETAALINDPGRTSGHFGLQLHGGQEMHVEFQAMEILTPVKAEVYPEFAELGALAPDFTLTDLSGNTHTLSDLRGKTVVLEWFNPGCPVVVRTHTSGPLVTMGNDVSGDDVVWLAINSGAPGKQGHGVKANREAVTKWSMEYPVLIDEAGIVGQRYRARTTPHMYVINPEGQLVYNGAIDNSPSGRPGDEYKNFVEMALECVADGREIDFGASPYGCSVKYASGGGKGGGRRGRKRN
ncbi:MAG: DUF1080 domain-containing protein [Planctomycetes bacterium]|nr:DUF1080 domain-containing protein [Planctomycetota bacterium]